jgi:AAA family ATP:ADP antiporter
MLVLRGPTLEVTSEFADSRSLAQRRRSAHVSALAFFFVLTSYYIVRPVRDQLGGAVGSSQLPLFLRRDLRGDVAADAGVRHLVARFPRRRLLGWSYSFFVACLLAFIPVFMAQDRLVRARDRLVFSSGSACSICLSCRCSGASWPMFSAASGARGKYFRSLLSAESAGAIFGPMLTSALSEYGGCRAVALCQCSDAHYRSVPVAEDFCSTVSRNAKMLRLRSAARLGLAQRNSFRAPSFAT